MPDLSTLQSQRDALITQIASGDKARRFQDRSQELQETASQLKALSFLDEEINRLSATKASRVSFASHRRG